MAANTRRVLRRALSDCASIGLIASLSSVEETIILKLNLVEAHATFLMNSKIVPEQHM